MEGDLDVDFPCQAHQLICAQSSIPNGGYGLLLVVGPHGIQRGGAQVTTNRGTRHTAPLAQFLSPEVAMFHRGHRSTLRVELAACFLYGTAPLKGALTMHLRGPARPTSTLNYGRQFWTLQRLRNLLLDMQRKACTFYDLPVPGAHLSLLSVATAAPPPNSNDHRALLLGFVYSTGISRPM